MEMYSTLNKNIVTLAVDSIEYEAFIGHSLPFSEELSAVKVVNGIVGIAVVVKFLQKNQYRNPSMREKKGMALTSAALQETRILFSEGRRTAARNA